MTRPAVLSLALVAALSAGCRCGDRASTPAGAGEQGFVWASRWSVDDVPAGSLSASLGGESLEGLHVQVREEGDSTRIEIMDTRPGKACGRDPDAQGFSVKLPGMLGKGDRLEKSMDDHPRGWSAFMVTRGSDGSAVSSVAHGWSFALEVTELDARGRIVKGRLAVGFDDEERSGAAGGFTGEYCQE